MDATERDLRHLLDLFAVLPGMEGEIHERQWARFAEAIGRPGASGYMRDKLSAIKSLLSELESGDMVEARKSGAHLAKYILYFFGGDEDGPLKGEPVKMLSNWLGSGVPSLGRLWLDDVVQTAWRIYLANPKRGELADARPIGEKWGGWGNSKWDTALRRMERED